MWSELLFHSNELIMHKLESLESIPYDISWQLTICTIQSERFAITKCQIRK
jgi:hypothetical protein